MLAWGAPLPTDPSGAGLGAAPHCGRVLPLPPLSCERKVRGFWLEPRLCRAPAPASQGGWQRPLPTERGALQIPPAFPAGRAGTGLCWRLLGTARAPNQCSQFAGLGRGTLLPSRPAPRVPSSPRRLIELHSPDSRNTLILRCKDTATAHSWFTALHANIAALLPQVLAELNAMLGTGGAAAGGREVKHIAWLAEQVCATGAVLEVPLWGPAPSLGTAALTGLWWQPESSATRLGTGLCHPTVPWPAGYALAKVAFPVPSALSPAGISQLETLVTPSLFCESTAR